MPKQLRIGLARSIQMKRANWKSANDCELWLKPTRVFYAGKKQQHVNIHARFRFSPTIIRWSIQWIRATHAINISASYGTRQAISPILLSHMRPGLSLTSVSLSGRVGHNTFPKFINWWDVRCPRPQRALHIKVPVIVGKFNKRKTGNFSAWKFFRSLETWTNKLLQNTSHGYFVYPALAGVSRPNFRPIRWKNKCKQCSVIDCYLFLLHKLQQYVNPEALGKPSAVSEFWNTCVRNRR